MEASSLTEVLRQCRDAWDTLCQAAASDADYPTGVSFLAVKSAVQRVVQASEALPRRVFAGSARELTLTARLTEYRERADECREWLSESRDTFNGSGWLSMWLPKANEFLAALDSFAPSLPEPPSRILVTLSGREQAVLRYLWSNPATPLDTLQDECWQATVEPESVRRAVQRLAEKVARFGVIIDIKGGIVSLMLPDK